MMRAVLAILALFTVTAIPAVSQTAPVTSAGELNGWCEIFNRAAMPSDPAQAFNGGLCQGFINGWMQGVSNLSWADDKGVIHTAALADVFTVGQLARIFVGFMDRHADLENKPSDSVLAKAVQDFELNGLPVRTAKPAGPSRGVPKITPVSRIVVPFAPDSSGLLEVPVSINGVPTDALFDSGASDVTGDFSKFAIEKTGEKSFSVATGDRKRVATGTAVVCVQRVCLKVTADDTASDTAPLLGQSFIKLFQVVSIDRDSRTITFVPAPPKVK